MNRWRRYELIVITLLFSLMILHAAANEDAVESHVYADGVLAPRFNAAYNDWAYQHPTGQGHARGLDIGDRKRWQLVRETFRATDDAYKRAGY